MNELKQIKTSSPTIIGISSLIAGGKDFCGYNLIFKKLCKLHPTLIWCFADHFKIDTATRESTFNEVFGSNRTSEIRQKLQKYGTELGRNVFGENIWIRTAENWMILQKSRGIEKFIFCDVRFPNEAKWIKDNGGIVIRLIAPNRTWARAIGETKGDVEQAKKNLNHPSETALSGPEHQHLFDYIVHNDYGEEESCKMEFDKIINTHFS